MKNYQYYKILGFLNIIVGFVVYSKLIAVAMFGIGLIYMIVSLILEFKDL